SGVLMGIFQSNAGGAWDNAKKSFEKGVLINGEMFYKKSEPHKASVTGDTVGDPFKDTSGPSMNILIKLMSIVSLVIAPYIAVEGGMKADKSMVNGAKTECCAEMGEGMDMGNCDMEKCMNMTQEECAAYCDSMQCTPAQKEMCLKHAKGGACEMEAEHCKKDSGKCATDEKGGCMEGCEHKCDSKEACEKSCGEKCAAHH
ncbi:MAG: sodium/proton-translocating pyrophosphatase, partial [Bacteroidia bacterium]